MAAEFLVQGCQSSSPWSTVHSRLVDLCVLFRLWDVQLDVCKVGWNGYDFNDTGNRDLQIHAPIGKEESVQSWGNQHQYYAGTWFGSCILICNSWSSIYLVRCHRGELDQGWMYEAGIPMFYSLMWAFWQCCIVRYQMILADEGQPHQWMHRISPK